MFHLNKRKIVISFVICLLLSATKVFACGCFYLPNEVVSDEVKNAAEHSTMVFVGKVVGFEYRKDIPKHYLVLRDKDSDNHIDYETQVVKFQVERWWKGEATSEIFLVTDNIKNSDGTASSSSCDYSFEEGKSYLVYANGKENELRTNACARTKPFIKAEEDIKILGEGKEPVEKKNEPNKSMDVRAKQRLCYQWFLVNSKLRGGGFAPRHLSRSALSGEMTTVHNLWDLM